jgi:hypothetical protein
MQAVYRPGRQTRGQLRQSLMEMRQARPAMAVKRPQTASLSYLKNDRVLSETDKTSAPVA